MARDSARAIAAEPQVGDRRQRIHDRDHVGRRELVLDEVDERLAHRHVVAAPHVIVVQQDARTAGRRARGFRLFVEVVLDLRGADRTRSGRSASIFTTANASIFCGLPSSATENSSGLRSRTGLPFLSVTMTSTRT